MNDTEKAVPLIERLRRVPSDARLIVEEDYFSSSYYAVGLMAHEAAAEIERLQASMREAVLAEREACVELCLEHSKLNVDNASAHEFGKQVGAAICATAIRARNEQEQPR